jgi:hypothetical protein
MAEFRLQHVHGLEEGAALLCCQPGQHPGQWCRHPVQPGFSRRPLAFRDGHDGAAPVRRVRHALDETGQIEPGEQAADRGHRQAQPRRQVAHGHRPVP